MSQLEYPERALAQHIGLFAMSKELKFSLNYLQQSELTLGGSLL